MMNLQDFIAKYTGVANVGDTPENQGECVGLIEKWTDNLGLPHTWGNAKDLLADADSNFFDIIYNTPTGVPGAGDIFTFNGNYGAGNGHTGIVVSATTTSVELFEQNDPDGSYPHLKTYTYNDSIGWLHPKNEPNNQGGDMALTADQINYLYSSGLGRAAQTSDIEGNVGKDPGGLIDLIRTSPERASYQDFETNATYLGFLQRPAEQGALAGAKNYNRIEFVNGVEASPEAATVKAQYETGANASGNYTPVTETLYTKN